MREGGQGEGGVNDEIAEHKAGSVGRSVPVRLIPL